MSGSQRVEGLVEVVIVGTKVGLWFDTVCPVGKMTSTGKSTIVGHTVGHYHVEINGRKYGLQGGLYEPLGKEGEYTNALAKIEAALIAEGWVAEKAKAFALLHVKPPKTAKDKPAKPTAATAIATAQKYTQDGIAPPVTLASLPAAPVVTTAPALAAPAPVVTTALAATAPAPSSRRLPPPRLPCASPSASPPGPSFRSPRPPPAPSPTSPTRSSPTQPNKGPGFAPVPLGHAWKASAPSPASPPLSVPWSATPESLRAGTAAQESRFAAPVRYGIAFAAWIGWYRVRAGAAAQERTQSL